MQRPGSRDRVALVCQQCGVHRLTKGQITALFTRLSDKAGRPAPAVCALFPELMSDTDSLPVESMLDVIFGTRGQEEDSVQVESMVDEILNIRGQEAGQALVGAWENIHTGFPYKVQHTHGVLNYVESGMEAWRLEQRGTWFEAELPGRSVRLRPGPWRQGVAYQQRGNGAEDWSKPVYGAKAGGPDAGAEVLTMAATTLWHSIEDPQPIGLVPQGTRLKAAGPPRADGRGLRLLPLQPSGRAVWAAHVRLLDAAEAEEGRDGEGGGAKRYSRLGSLVEALADGDTALLRGTWVRDRAERGEALPRRQALPPEALWAPAELGPLLRSRQVQVVAVGRCWRSAEHPDLQGEQLRVLGRALGARLAEGTMPVQDLAVFVDWCSLYQEPWNVDQCAAFGRSREVVDLWYAHAATTVITLPPQPTEGVQHGDEWPFFEQAVGSMLKGGSQLLDLGRQRSPTDWLSLSGQCARCRRPPMSPQAFADALKVRSFVHQADQEFLNRKYRETYDQVFRQATALDFTCQGWDVEEASILAAALPDCAALEKLVLRENPLGADGMAVLAEKLPLCPCLQELWIDRTAIGDRGAYALAEALPRCPRLRLLQVQGAGVGAEGAARIVAAVPKGARLQAIGLADNPLGPTGAEAILAVLQACSGTTLRVLHLERTGVEEAGKVRILAAWEAAGKDRQCLYF